MTESLLTQRTDVEKYLNRSPGQLSSFSFINIFAWQDFFRFEFKVMDDRLCVFARNEMGTFLYLPPLGGDIVPEVIESCFQVMEKDNGGNGVTRIENVSVDQLIWFPKEKFTHYNKGYEYCYYRKDIAGLQGNRYKSKRSSYNQFVNSYACQYCPFEESMTSDCLKLYQRWAEQRVMVHPDDIYGYMLKENEKVHKIVLEHFQSLHLTGRVVIVDGEIKAYSFGFPVNKEIFCVLFEVADLNIKGLAGYIFREFCRDKGVEPYVFINAMDDLGMDHMKEAKMSFHPSVLLPSYVVTKKE